MKARKMGQWSKKLTGEALAKRMSELADKRWAKKTPEERKAYSEKMLAIRYRVYRENKKKTAL